MERGEGRQKESGETEGQTEKEYIGEREIERGQRAGRGGAMTGVYVVYRTRWACTPSDHSNLLPYVSPPKRSRDCTRSDFAFISCLDCTPSYCLVSKI